MKEKMFKYLYRNRTKNNVINDSASNLSISQVSFSCREDVCGLDEINLIFFCGFKYIKARKATVGVTTANIKCTKMWFYYLIGRHLKDN